MNSLNGDSDKRRSNRLRAIFLGTAILGVIFCIVGIILLCNYTWYDGYEIVHDYTNCTALPGPSPDEELCKDKIKKPGDECACYIPISITKPMKAPVTVLYELESYEKMISTYSQSRDDDQLAGHLKSQPSDSCGSYTYADTATGKKPIAPCGLLADAMFNDTFSLVSNNKFVLNLRYGLLSEDDKKPFRNPPSNLSQAFKDFSKPKNWQHPVWELDTKNPDNNGFQNEAFIIWMKTDLKRKPAWQVNHTGIYEHGVPAANYTIRVTYAYPTSRYDGIRRVIISSVHTMYDNVKYGFGVALVVFGVLFLILAGLILIKYRSTIIWRR